MHHQHNLWIFALLQTRRWKEAVLRGGLHHQLTTQGSLQKTRRRSRRVRVWRMHQCDGEHQVEYLRNARRLRVLRILVGRGGCFGKEMLDACAQVGWELLQAHREVESTPGVLFLGGLNHVTQRPKWALLRMAVSDDDDGELVFITETWSNEVQ